MGFSVVDGKVAAHFGDGSIVTPGEIENAARPVAPESEDPSIPGATDPSTPWENQNWAVWVEGSGPGDGAVFHESIAIGDPCGNYMQFSFGWTGSWLIYGEVYIDSSGPGQITDRFAWIHKDEALFLLEHLHRQVGTEYVYTSSMQCRYYSQTIYDMFISTVVKHGHGVMPGPVPQRGAPSISAGGLISTTTSSTTTTTTSPASGFSSTTSTHATGRPVASSSALYGGAVTQEVSR